MDVGHAAFFAPFGQPDAVAGVLCGSDRHAVRFDGFTEHDECAVRLRQTAVVGGGGPECGSEFGVARPGASCDGDELSNLSSVTIGR